MDMESILVLVMALVYIGIGGIVVLSIRALLLLIKALKIYISNNE
ncbi:hypothetical protein [Peptacetobacter sp. AB845]